MSIKQRFSVKYQYACENRAHDDPYFEFNDKNISEEFRTQTDTKAQIFLIPTSTNGKFESDLEKKYNQHFKFKENIDFRDSCNDMKLHNSYCFHHKETNTYLIFFVIIDHKKPDHIVDCYDIYNVMNKIFVGGKKCFGDPRIFYIHKIGENEFFKSTFKLFGNVMNEVFDENCRFIVCDDSD